MVEHFKTIEQVHGIFVDAYVVDDADNLVFLSCWGHDTAIREFQSRLTVGSAEGGLSSFNVDLGEGIKAFVRIANMDELEQSTGRVQTYILGTMVHAMIYSREVIMPDTANHRAILLGNASDDALWDLAVYLAPVPLLSHWKMEILPVMRSAGMVIRLEGLGIEAWQIKIDETRLALLVKEAAMEGRITT